MCNLIIDTLKTSQIFKGVDKSSIEDIIKTLCYKSTSYDKGAIIAIEDDPCDKVGIVIAGSIEIKKMLESGKAITIVTIKEGGTFGEVIIFSDVTHYPSTIEAGNNCKVLFISKIELLKLCRNNDIILTNFMGLLSNKVLLLNKKVRSFCYNTLRQKIVNYLLDEYYNQKSFMLNLQYSRAELAEFLGIPRPSLSREMIKMKDENLIDFYKDSVKIINLEILKGYLG